MERVCLGTQPTSRKAEMRISPEREIFRSSLRPFFGVCRREEEKKHQRSPKLSSELSSSVFSLPSPLYRAEGGCWAAVQDLFGAPFWQVLQAQVVP